MKKDEETRPKRCKNCKYRHDHKFLGVVCEKMSASHFKLPENPLAFATCFCEGIDGELQITDEFGCVLFEDIAEVGLNGER